MKTQNIFLFIIAGVLTGILVAMISLIAQLREIDTNIKIMKRNNSKSSEFTIKPLPPIPTHRHDVNCKH